MACKSAVVVVDEFGKTLDGDATFCDDASALAISRNHVAVVRRGEVRLLRRDDRSTWAARSFHRDSRIGIGIGHRSGDPPPPPSSVLVVQRDDRFGLSDPAASPFVTVFGAREVPMLELTSELWR